MAIPPTQGRTRPPNPAWSMTPRRWRGLPEPERRVWSGKRNQRGVKKGDTPMAEESEASGTVGSARSGGKHVECHC